MSASWYCTGRQSAAMNKPYYILAVVCSAMFLDLCNLSAIKIALPSIRKDFDIVVDDLQWVISAYALTFGGFLLLGGRGSDMFGHRRAHIAHFMPPAEKAKALGIWGASGSLGFVLGLIIGGVLSDFLGWRWIFWISLILSGIAIVTAFLILPTPQVNNPQDATNPFHDVKNPAREPHAAKKFVHTLRERLLRFDVPGICLGIPGILLLTYAVTSANTVGLGSVNIVVTLVLAVVLLIAFVLYERQTSQAILTPHLFKSRSFNLTLVLAVNTYAVRQACTYFLTVQLQAYGNSPVHTAVLYIPLEVSTLIANTSSGRLVPILGARTMFIIGWALAIPGVILFSFIDQYTSYWRFTFPGMILYIAGIGAVYITSNFVVVSSASKSDQGAAAGIFNVALQVGGSVIGLAVLTAVAQGIDKKYGDTQQPAGTLSRIGYQSVYYSCVILSGLGLVLSLFAIKVPDSMRGSIWKSPGVKTVATAPIAGVNQDVIELDTSGTEVRKPTATTGHS